MPSSRLISNEYASPTPCRVFDEKWGPKEGSQEADKHGYSAASASRTPLTTAKGRRVAVPPAQLQNNSGERFGRVWRGSYSFDLGGFW